MGNIHEHEGISAEHDLKLCFFFFLSLTLFPTEQLAGSVNERSALQKHSTIHLVIACHSSCRGLHCSLRVGVCLGYFVSVFLPLLLMGWVGNRAHEKFPVLAFTTLIFEIDQYVCSSCLTKKQIHVFCCNLRLEVKDDNTGCS